MSDDPSEHADPEAATTPGSVFGNLPDSRPGGRSPRRDAATKSRGARATKATAKPRPKPKAKRTPPKTAAEPSPRREPPKAKRTTPAPEPEAAEPESRGGLEDIAWAGVAAAAEAATLGVRLANKAIEALRGNSERS